MAKLNDKYRGVLRKELQWLPDLIPVWMTDFQTEVMDLDTLSLKREYLNLGSCMSTYDQILLLNKEGQILGVVGYRVITHSKNNGRFTRLLTGEATHTYEIPDLFEETVEEALIRLGPASKEVQYILHLASSKKAKFHKVPNGSNIEFHLERKAAEAQMALARFIESA